MFLAVLAILLIVFSSPVAAQERPRQGGFEVRTKSWLVFTLPGLMDRSYSSDRTYRDKRGAVEFDVMFLQPHPGLEALLHLQLLAEKDDRAKTAYAFHNAQARARGYLEQWISLARESNPYNLIGGHSPNPLSSDTRIALEQINEKLVSASRQADAAAIREMAEPQLKLLKAHLGTEADQFLLRYVYSRQKGGSRAEFGELTARTENYGTQRVVRVTNKLPGRTHELIFLRIEDQAYAFNFRPDPAKKLNLEARIETVITSARHSPTAPNSNSRGKNKVQEPEDPGLILNRSALLSFVLLFLIAYLNSACDKAYDVCRSRVRLSIRESIRIFRTSFTLLTVLYIAYAVMIYEQMPIAGTLLTREDLSSLLPPMLLLITLCAAFATIGARVGFHRSKRLCRLGSIFGLLAGIVVAHNALLFILGAN